HPPCLHPPRLRLCLLHGCQLALRLYLRLPYRFGIFERLDIRPGPLSRPRPCKRHARFQRSQHRPASGLRRHHDACFSAAPGAHHRSLEFQRLRC
ncbi:hypothetical protein B0H12DRAFT_1144602, partial [Mycena haematopus]